MRLNTPAPIPTAQTIQTLKVEKQNTPPAAPTVDSTTPVITSADILPKPTSVPKVTLSAINGNIFIRRGPDLAYNPIGILYKNNSAEVLQRDVLSKWAQIIIPNSDQTGWVSIQTSYTKIDGDLTTLPEYTPVDWPVPAYLRNCTHHQMYIMPNEVILSSSFFQPENEIWLYPGSYTIHDLDVPGEPDVLQVEIREGVTIDITTDGLGEHRKCP